MSDWTAAAPVAQPVAKRCPKCSTFMMHEEGEPWDAPEWLCPKCHHDEPATNPIRRTNATCPRCKESKGLPLTNTKEPSMHCMGCGFDYTPIYPAPPPAEPAPDADEADTLLRALNLDPERYRTEGGALNLPKIKAAIKHPDEYPRTTPNIAQALNAAGCERLRDFFQVGPVQRAAVESFADALTAQPALPTEGMLMGWYMEFDRTAGKEWTNAEYLIKWATYVAARASKGALTTQPVPGVRESLEADRESRRMFVARLEKMDQQGDKWLTVQAILALLNDCDMLASRALSMPAVQASEPKL